MKMNRLISAAVFSAFLLFLSPWGSAGEKSASKRLELKDVFELEYASDPQISPDGKQVVYVRNSMDIMTDRRRSSLWSINFDGSDHRALTTGNGNDTSPRWSPDGKQLASIISSNGTAQIHLRWMDTGQTGKLTKLTGKPADLTWSPDGEWLAFSMFVSDKPKPFVQLPAKPKGAKWAEPAKMIRKIHYRHDGEGYAKEGYHHLFVIPAEGGTPRQLTSGPFHHRGTLAWTPDGTAILFSANRNSDWEYRQRGTEIFEVSVTDGRIEPLTERRGPDHSPAVSPDGNKIAFVGYDDRMQSYQVSQLYVANRDGSERRVVSQTLDRSVQAPVWSRDGSGLYIRYDDRGNSKLAFISLGGKIETLAENIGGTTIGRPYPSGTFSVAANGAFALTESQPHYPGDVAVGRRGSEKSRRVTRLNDDLLAHKTLGSVEEIWYTSSVKGRKIHGWIVKPPGFDPAKKYPLILEIHGGPFASYGPRFSVEIQLYAAAGYVVFYANPSGSTGYGGKFGNLIHQAYPGDDYHDLMAGVDELLRRGYVDKQNLFVTGGSGGGVLTTWIVGKTNRFRAAVAAKPAVNWYSFVLTTDSYPYFTKYWFPGEPWNHVEHYLKLSPISQVGNVTTPTMLMTGESDFRTPISESEQFYQALKLRKVDTALVRIPGSSHNIAARPSNLISKVAHILKWFEVYRADE